MGCYRLKSFTAIVLLFFLLTCNLSAVEEKNIFGMELVNLSDGGIDGLHSKAFWQPELDYDVYSNGSFQISGSISAWFEKRVDIIEDSENFIDNASAYRNWLRLTNQATELRIGLQRINFGTAQILRPLKWFDNLSYQDIFERSEGVNAMLFKQFFGNSSSVWLWSVLPEDVISDEFSIKDIEQRLEYGGRIQYPFPYIQPGLSWNYKTLYANGSDSGREYRFGLDTRFDHFIGMWTETAVFRTDLLDSEDAWMASNTLGMDYTVSIGNGLYLMSETNMNHMGYAGWEAMEPQTVTSALAMTYPLGILDSVIFTILREWKNDHGRYDMLFRRTYDHLGFEIGAGFSSIKSSGKARDKTLRLSLNYTI